MMILVIVQDTAGQMSAGEASLYGGLGGGLIGGVFALIGVLAGLIVEHKLRSSGKIRCNVGRYNHHQEIRIEKRRIAAPENWHELEGEELEKMIGTHKFVIRFFNEKDEATGLSNISIVFVGKDGHEVALQRGMRTYDYPTDSDERSGTLDLPSRRWVTMDFGGFVYGEDALLADRNWKRIEVRGQFPSGKQHKFVVREQ
jgi:hypothetical protein